MTIAKSGLYKDLPSRADHAIALKGTKEWVVRNSRTYIGIGKKDKKAVVIIPVIPRGQVNSLLLFHVEFDETLSTQDKVSFLKVYQDKYADLKSHVTEMDMQWNDSFLELLTVRDCVTMPVGKLAEKILQPAVTSKS